MIKRNIKMVVTPEESKQVQEICFANGIVWETLKRHVGHIQQKYIFISSRYITYGETAEFFKEHHNEEVDATFFIKTKGSCVEENQEQELKQNIKEEQMKDNEVETYKDVKEYLVAKGLYDRVMEIEWDAEDVYESFSDLYLWANTEEGVSYWDEIDDELRDLDINRNIESLVQDYKAKQEKEFIQHLETQPEEVVDETPEQPTEAKPKQYLVFVPQKGKPKRIHQSLESAQEEAKRLCKSELCEVMVLEVVSKYQAKVIVEEV